MPFVPMAALRGYVGKDFGRSEWFTINQERVDQSAEYTGDHQFIHADLEKAVEVSFGDTIVRGFLSLSLIPKLMEGLLVLPEGLKIAVNYGLGTVRFIQPVRVGSRVRLDLTLLDVDEGNPGQRPIKACATLETEGQEKPTYITEILSLCLV